MLRPRLRTGRVERRLASLEARPGQDSSNSSRPPSSDPPHAKRRRGGVPWASTAKVYRKLASGESRLWTLATSEGMPPHNNATGRALRHGVIRRKTGHGTAGEAGSRFAERMPSGVAT